MAYDWSQRRVQVALAASTASGAVIGRLVPGRNPFRIRSAALTIETAVADEATITIQRRPVAGAAANEVTIDTIVVGTGHAAGTVVYVDGLNTRISPGEDLAFTVTGTGASGVVSITATIEEENEAAANDASLVLSA